MQRCSNRAYTKCPYRYLCGHIEEAVFTEDSECAAFNREVESQPMKMGDKIRAMSDDELAKMLVNSLAGGFEMAITALYDITNRDLWEEKVLVQLKQPAEGE